MLQHVSRILLQGRPLAAGECQAPRQFTNFKSCCFPVSIANVAISEESSNFRNGSESPVHASWQMFHVDRIPILFGSGDPGNRPGRHSGYDGHFPDYTDEAGEYYK